MPATTYHETITLSPCAQTLAQRTMPLPRREPGGGLQMFHSSLKMDGHSLTDEDIRRPVL